MVDVAESRLLTALGLRTLAPGSPDYHPQCAGNIRARDGAYHQGTVRPWLVGAFAKAWVRARGDRPEVRQLVRERCFPPLIVHL